MKNLSSLQTIALACAASVALAAPLFSQSSTTGNPPPTTVKQTSQAPDEPYWTQHGRLTYGVQFGFGIENDIPNNISHINFFFVAPQIGFIAWDHPHSRLPLKRFELISQQMLGGSTHPGGSLIGTSLVFRFGFKPIGRVVPYFDAGTGPLHTTIDVNVPELTGHTQFLSQGGVGVQYFVRPQRAFVIEYHYFHMSNAGIAQPNHGFNGSMVSVGFRWLRRPRPSSVGTLHSSRFHLPHLW